MERMSIACPQCRTQGTVERTWEGRTITCTQCGTAFPVRKNASSTIWAPVETLQVCCPFCAEEILATVLVCPHCKQNLINPSHNTIRATRDTGLGSVVGEPGFHWGEWTAGRRTIFISACIAVLSQFFSWVDIGFASANGISQGGFLFLGFFVYPCLALFRDKDISVWWGVMCALGAVGSTIAYIASKGGELFGEEVNVTAGGAYVFLLCAVALGVGVVLDHFTPQS
ncbi:MAG: hypothetical protein ACYDBB_04705 [Armatimonadota bacterium]